MFYFCNETREIACFDILTESKRSKDGRIVMLGGGRYTSYIWNWERET